MKVLETLDFSLKTSVVAGAVGIFGCAAFAGTDLDPLTADGVLTIPASTTVSVDDDNAAAFSALTGVVFAATSSTLAFSNTEVLNVNAALSGAKGKVTGSGPLVIFSSSPTFGGTFTLSTTSVVVSNRYAFGSSSASVNSQPGAAATYSFRGAGITNDAAISYNGQNHTFSTPDGETLVFNGNVQSSSGGPSVKFGSAVFNGKFGGGGSPVYSFAEGSESYINGGLNPGGNFNLFGTTGTAIMHFHPTSVSIGSTFTIQRRYVILCETKNAFASNVNLQDTSSNVRCIDLGGLDQSMSKLSMQNYAGSASSKTFDPIVSAEPATLTINAVGTSPLESLLRFRQKASLTYNGTGTLNLNAAVSDTEGTLTVKKGTLGLVNNCEWQGTNVVIEGGTLAVSSARGITNRATRLVITGGTLALNAAVHVKSASIAGVELDPAAYAVEDLPAELQQYVTGTAKLYVDYEEGQVVYKASTWSGGGADALLTTAENWADGKAPNFKDGGATLVFPAGANAVVDGSIAVYGIQFLGDAGTVLFGDANAKIKLGPGGILSSNDQAAVSYVITNEIAVTLQTTSSDPDEWKACTGTAVDYNCDILAAGASEIKAFGGGRHIFRGDNSAVERPFRFGRGYYEAYTRTSFGAPTRDTQIADSKARFFFHCLTNDVPLKGDFANSNPDATDSVNQLWCDPERGLVQNGRLTFNIGASSNIGGVSIRGGVSGGNQMIMSAVPVVNAYGTALPCEIRDTAADFATGGALGIMLSSGTMTLSTTGNNWGSYNIRSSKSTLVCGAPGVMPTSRMITFGDRPDYPSGTFDMNGFNQSTPGMDHNFYNFTREYYKGARYGTVTSAVPACLTWSGTPSLWFDATGAKTINPTNSVRFRGEAALRVNSNYKHTIINAKSDTVGTLEILKGTLTFAWGAGWSAATNVVVSGGMLRVEEESAPYAFGPRQGRSAAFLSVTGEGRVQLDGGQATAYALSTDGEVFLEPGVYGGSEAGLDAAHTLSCLSGKGTLKVRTNGTPNGIVLIVR